MSLGAILMSLLAVILVGLVLSWGHGGRWIGKVRAGLGLAVILLLLVLLMLASNEVSDRETLTEAGRYQREAVEGVYATRSVQPQRVVL